MIIYFLIAWLRAEDMKICVVCTKVGSYIDTIVKELKFPLMEIRDQFLTHDQVNVKLEDDHLKKRLR